MTKKPMKAGKLAFLVLLALSVCGPAGASTSMLYSVESGDIKDAFAVVERGVGRIDFDGNGLPLSADIFIKPQQDYAMNVGKFTRNGHEYIYVGKSNKADQTSTKSTTYYDFFDPSVGLDAESPIGGKNRPLELRLSQVDSIDVALPPNPLTGMVYALDCPSEGTFHLLAYDPLSWSTSPTSVAITGYDACRLVNIVESTSGNLYIWASKRADTKAALYTPVSSDILVFNTATNPPTLDRTLHFVRTGFEPTARTPDDSKSEKLAGRGIAPITTDTVDATTGKVTGTAVNFLALVTYESADATGPSIVRIEDKLTGKNDDVTRIIVSSDLKPGWDIDIESPFSDGKGGFYFTSVASNDNSKTMTTNRESCIYHWAEGTSPVSMDQENVTANGEQVISSGKYKGSIFAYKNNTDGTMDIYLWDGKGTPIQIDKEAGVEIERPFSDGADGFYFAVEQFVTKTSDDKDGIYHWKVGEKPKLIFQSNVELDVENPPLAGDTIVDGFYFVNTSPDLNETTKTGTVTATLILCKDTVSKDVYTFDPLPVPKSVFNKTAQDTPASLLTTEKAFLEDEERKLLFLSVYPVGGSDCRLAVFNYADKANLGSPYRVYKSQELGGNVSIAGALFFTDGKAALKPGFDVATNESAKKAIEATFGPDVEVVTVDSADIGSERTKADLSTAELAIIGTRDIAAVLPKITPKKTAVYVLRVPYDKTLTGTLEWHGFPTTAGTIALAAGENTCVFLDDSGTEIWEIPSNGVNAAVMLTAGKTYAPVVTVSTTNGPTSNKGSGGCDAGFGGAALLALAGLALLRKHGK